MKKVTDIDIDFADRDTALQHIPHTAASLIKDNVLKQHNVGVYLHEVPVDPVTGFCSIEYKQAEANGFFKMDFLNVGIYKDVKSPEHLNALMAAKPMWELLEDEQIVDTLFHIKGHFDIVGRMRPRSVMQLAMVLAMIRPAKKHLVGKAWSDIEQSIWVINDNETLYAFKKSHAVSYALAIVVQMNLLVESASA